VWGSAQLRGDRRCLLISLRRPVAIIVAIGFDDTLELLEGSTALDFEFVAKPQADNFIFLMSVDGRYHANANQKFRQGGERCRDL
jgi:hypothetical protein